MAACSDEHAESLPKYTAADSLQVIRDNQAAQSVLCFLTGQSSVSLTEGTRLTATFGTVRDESKPYTRAYPADNADEAESLFRCIAGSADNLLTKTDEGLVLSLNHLILSLGAEPTDVGSIVFHPGGEGTVAYADVDIPVITNLRRIEYVDSASWGENAVAGGYKKGDILKYIGTDSRIAKGSLWICTRQVNGGIEGCLSLLEFRPGSALSLEGKTDDPNYAPCPVTQFIGDVTKKYGTDDPHRLVALREMLNLLGTMDKRKKEKILSQMPGVLPEGESCKGFRVGYGVICEGYDGESAIIYDARYVSKFWFYDNREISYVTLPKRCTKVSEVKAKVFNYITKNTWTEQFWNKYWRSLYIYNAKTFTDRMDSEFAVVLSP